MVGRLPAVPRVGTSPGGMPLVGVALVGLMLLGACARDDDSVITVFAAASLADAFTDIESAFEEANPDLDVRLNLAGSSALRVQILEGAPADVFASANEATMQQVVNAGAVTGQPQVFARNHLQIAVPDGNPADITGLDDFAHPDLLLGLCAAGVPCGDLARLALDRAGIDAAIDTEEPDVRALLTKIVEGELDAGVVYVTDVLAAAGRVEAIDLPSAVETPARYPIARIGERPDADGAQAFVTFVLSAQGQAILAEHGFDAP
jgi:molybdate transport system substrate-binding protein